MEHLRFAALSLAHGIQQKTKPKIKSSSMKKI